MAWWTFAPDPMVLHARGPFWVAEVLVAVVSYSEIARREAELARAELARAENARRFALRQVDDGLCEYFLRVASRYESDSSDHAERARRFEALAAGGELIATL